MARYLITSGPTREYLDPVRYLTNASSGKMGAALALAALRLGHAVDLVSGPVELAYPSDAAVTFVETTDQMLRAAMARFAAADVLIAAAAPCDYRPESYSERKLKKTGTLWTMRFVETPDILGTLGALKTHQVVMGFALETHLAREHALSKARDKHCDLIVVNGPATLHADVAEVEALDGSGVQHATLRGSKVEIAKHLVALCEQLRERHSRQ